MTARLLCTAAILLSAGGCAATRRLVTRPRPPQPPAGTRSGPSARSWAAAGSRPRSRVTGLVAGPRQAQAIVTAQTENRLLLVDLPSARVVRRIPLAGEPEYVADGCRVIVAVSAASGQVTLLDRRSLRPLRVFGGFVSPHIPAVSPDCDYAYVTDDATGVLTAISLRHDRILSRTYVGAGAHHLALGLHEHHIWVALGQSASSITIVSTISTRSPGPARPVQDPSRMGIVGQLRPGFQAHDLMFTPNDRRVWVTSANTSTVTVFDARTHRPLLRIPAGPPPQHIVFDAGSAYLTSGYGSRIERVSIVTGRVLARARAPYGSFDLDARGGYVVTSSLLTGTLAVYDRRLRRLRVRRLAPSAEDVALVDP